MSTGNAGYAIGGAQALIRLIAEKFTALGGQMRFGTRVEKILVEDDAAVGVQLAGARSSRPAGSFQPPTATSSASAVLWRTSPSPPREAWLDAWSSDATRRSNSFSGRAESIA